ncbi:MAG: hypothetical protein ACKOET_07535, partial [Verrucomicrobiota bacterium]
PGQTPVNLIHAQFIYAGYSASAPPGSDLWYSHGLANIDGRHLGELTWSVGNEISTEFSLARPPSALTPPYHLLPLAIPETGGLLIGSAVGVPWAGRDFNSIFPWIDLAAVIAQVRSDDLRGGPVESLLRWMLQQGATGTSPTPISEIPVLPEPWPNGYYPDFPAGPVWGFSETGAPLDLSLTYTNYISIGDPDSAYLRTEYAFWRLTGPDFLVIPEVTSGKVLLPGFLALAAGIGWRRATLHRRRAA